MSIPRIHRRAFCLLLAGVLGLLTAPSFAPAGSVFMKNGYIIQGPIVEHSDSHVVLGWPQGKVTIYRRFLERVDFEPGEEKKVKQPEAATPLVEEEVVVTPAGEADELPASLSELVQKYGLPGALIEPRSGTAPAPAADPGPGTEGAAPPAGEGTEVVSGESVPGSGTPSPGPSVENVPPSGEGLAAEAVTDPSWGFSLRPPEGWKVSEVEGCVSWSGPPGTEGFASSMNVTSLPRGSLKWEEVCRALREDQAAPLRDYHLETQEPFKVGDLGAFRVAGRGVVTAGEAERKVWVHQVLVEKGDRLWLVSTFLESGHPQELAAVLDRSLQTFKPGR